MSRKPKTNFTLVERDFAAVIVAIREGDGSGLLSSMSNQRKTITFINHTKLYIRERVVKEEIVFYQYDWVTDQDEEIMKFHSEEHPDDIRYQTATEPHHIHPADRLKLTNRDRLPNFKHQELHAILEAIQIHIFATKALHAASGTSIKKKP